MSNEIEEAMKAGLTCWYPERMKTIQFTGEREELAAEIRNLDMETHLLVSCENRFALKNFCGDYDSFTNRCFDGIEDYQDYISADKKYLKGRQYSKAEIEDILQTLGLKKSQYRFYSVLPGLSMPQQFYAEDYLPEEHLSIRYTPLYNHPESVFLREKRLYDGIIKNGMFHLMANAYLIDISLSEKFPFINHVTVSMDRGKEKAMATIIRKDGYVEKKALFEDGIPSVHMLYQNTVSLKKRGVAVVPLSEPECGSICMPYIHAPSALSYLKNLGLKKDTSFISEVEKFINCILSSSEESECIPDKYKELGPVYKDVYIDMVPLNAFYQNGDFLFYDQEFVFHDYPINVVIMRALDIIYEGDKRMEDNFPLSYFLDKYSMSSKANAYRRMGDDFIYNLRSRDELFDFNQKHLADMSRINENRERLNYSGKEYEELFVNFLCDAEDKKFYVFGSGQWARKFIAEVSDCIKIEALLDNNESRWGQELDGIKIINPDELKLLSPSSYKVIICVKNYSAIRMQLNHLGVDSYGIYSPSIEYRVPQRELPFHRDTIINTDENKDTNRIIGALPEQKQTGICQTQAATAMKENVTASDKKYKVGYIAGVFDLFHIGHLNLLRRAKEHCEMLLVGVVSDEQACKNKNRSPYVNEKERLEIVQACRYVDNAFLLPFAACGTRDVYKKYHFDVQFSGSDYEKDPFWLKEQEWLRERGADMVFFPYTQSTSSTKLKQQIEGDESHKKE